MADTPERAAIGEGFAVLADAEFHLARYGPSAVYLKDDEALRAFGAIPQEKAAIAHKVVQMPPFIPASTWLAGGRQSPGGSCLVGIRPSPTIQHEAVNQELAVRLVDDPDFGQPVVYLVAPLGTPEIPPVSLGEAAILPGPEVPSQVRERDQDQAADGPTPQEAEEARQAAKRASLG